jgi:hypothetical protein
MSDIHGLGGVFGVKGPSKPKNNNNDGVFANIFADKIGEGESEVVLSEMIPTDKIGVHQVSNTEIKEVSSLVNEIMENHLGL